jgi:hypothetical protein
MGKNLSAATQALPLVVFGVMTVLAFRDSDSAWSLNVVFALGFLGLFLFYLPQARFARWNSMGASLVTGAVMGLSLFLSQAEFTLDVQRPEDAIDEIETDIDELRESTSLFNGLVEGGLPLRIGRGCLVFVPVQANDPDVEEQLSKPGCQAFFKRAARQDG